MRFGGVMGGLRCRLKMPRVIGYAIPAEKELPHIA